MFIPYYVDDIESERFYKLPKEFVNSDLYRKELDSNMKVMYSLLRDRYELSKQNNWVDKDGVVYCIYSRENLANDLNVSVSTVTRCIRKLVELDLMREVRKGLNKPNWMYIGQVKQGLSLFTSQDSSKVRQSDTDFNETEKIKRYIITSNDGYIFEYYLNKYKERFNKEHPTVTHNQIDEMKSIVLEIGNEYNLSDINWKRMIDEHFYDLPESNNGNILGFLDGNSVKGITKRYAENEYYG